ncbi:MULTISPECIES: response regulator transcription factor [unclassified Streptomyces]|uniref:response regulator transcription factor n=1 Tax=unclassified Streptomyces TaxID=2593676 RepID=UPI001F0428D5|nr:MULTISPECIES: response regulator transcription factor [unclassified Streptomyces]MCH0566462.1 response regulator transcription factor [Streptomyces sp. MUM 2J]MCH0571880.1 response regulator transcription factor [Streptomyces sp. MUM 136J]
MQTSGQRIRVVVADDHPLYRAGVTRALNQSGQAQVVAEAADGAEALDLIRAHEPDVAVVDYQLPKLDGIAVVRAVVRDRLPTRALLLSAYTDDALIFNAVQEGAAGYLGKDASVNEIVDSVARVHRGGTVLPDNLTTALMDQVRRHAAADRVTLSERETQVLCAFAAGQSIPQIAEELYLAPSTVKTHTQRLYEKLGVSDRAAAVAEAMRRGLLE